jgi:serine/threonine protein kinase
MLISEKHKNTKTQKHKTKIGSNDVTGGKRKREKKTTKRKKRASIGEETSQSRRKTKDAQEYVVKQCDVYGLGRTILELYYRLTEQEFIKPGKVLGNPRFLNASSSIEFRKNVSLPLFTLIQKMCAPDPFIRIGLAKAKTEFLALLPALKEAFTFKDIKKNELPSPIEHKHSYNGAIYNL